MWRSTNFNGAVADTEVYDDARSACARSDPGTCNLLPAPWFFGVWRPRGTRWPNGAGTGCRSWMADKRTDAGSHRGLSVAPRAPRDPGWDLCVIPSRRLLGRLGGRMGVHPAEFCNRRRVGCALRVPRRSATCHRDFLWREPRRDRADPAFLLPAGEAWDGGLAAMGA